MYVHLCFLILSQGNTTQNSLLITSIMRRNKQFTIEINANILKFAMYEMT